MKQTKRLFRNTLKQGALLSMFLLLTSCASVPAKVASTAASGFGGTGIVGTVTGFGSIWVNGVEVEYDKNTPIRSRLLAKDKLKLGQQVVLETYARNKQTRTRNISVYYPIAGKITHVKRGQITINNRYVVKTHKARRDRGLHLRVGEFVAINGFSMVNGWVATRINHNVRHQSFYQPVPNIHFSGAVKKVLIESSVVQLRQWGKVRSGLNYISGHRDRIIMIGLYKHNRIQINAIKPYSSIPKSSPKAQLINYLEPTQ